MFESQEQLEYVEQLGDSSSQAVAMMIIVPLIIGVALKGVMSKLWAMLNTLQLINAISIVRVSVPSNVMTVQQKSHEIINFQPIPKDLVYGWIFGEKEELQQSEIIDTTAVARRFLQDKGIQEEEDFDNQEQVDAISSLVKTPSYDAL